MCMVLLQQFGYLRFSSVLYLRIYFVSYPFLLLYDFGSAILRACGNSRYPFLALTLSGIVNVFLNIIFVVFFKLGVSGVAAATVLSTMLSALLLICRLKKDTSSFPFALHKCDLYSGSVSAILKVGIPSAIQGAVFCFANIFVQASVNSFGSSAIAGSTIAMNFEYFTYYVITAFDQTATTFTSQNYSAGQLYRCRKILRICLVFSIVSSLILIEPLVIFRNFFSGFFSARTNSDTKCLPSYPVHSFFRTAVQPVRDPGRRIKRYRTFPVPGCCYYYWKLLFSHCMDLYGFQTLSSVKYSVLCVPDFMGVNDNPYYNRIHCKKAR